MKKLNVILLFIFFLFQTISSWAYTPPTAKVTAIVVDEKGQPMDGIAVEIGFESGGKVNGITNSTGKFSAARGTVRGVAFYVNKDGYYPIYTEYNFYNLQNDSWLPWNPEVELVMRKIEKPVPMYARDTKKSGPLKIPVIGKQVGFDLMEYDWVAPYGKGQKADFIFKLEKQFVDDKNYSSKLIITFSNKYDGIQKVKEDIRYGSAFKLPRNAPQDGYQTELVKVKKRSPGKSTENNFEEDNNYIFRIRSEEDGELVKAMYGKIQGEIRFEPRGKETATIFMKYYLNPDYTRNLEFDTKRNLFLNLPERERVDLN